MLGAWGSMAVRLAGMRFRAGALLSSAERLTMSAASNSGSISKSSSVTLSLLMKLMWGVSL
jgi:hypothetical protein